MNIRTKRLLLRPFDKRDEGEMISLLTDSDFMAYSPSGAMELMDAVNRFRQLREYKPEEIGKLAVIELNSGKLIGYCGVEPFEYRENPHIELGYRLASSARGNGYAFEASKAILNQLQQKGYDSVLALTHVDNKVSRHILYKLGFKTSDKGDYQGMPVQYYTIELA